MDEPKIGGYRKPTKDSAGAKRYASGKFDKLPPKVDLRKFMTFVEEQIGASCVANTLALGMNILLIVKGGGLFFVRVIIL